MITDQQQRQRAIDPTQSYIVQAPAGSGKTEILVQRYLTLLAEACENPEEILAITFTRKAAAEMRERILISLQNAQSSAPTIPHLKQSWDIANAVLKKNQRLQWNLLNNPQRLRIQTIDGFCASIVRRMPLTTGMGLAAGILENPQQVYKEATTRLLANIDTAHQAALATLLLHLDKSMLRVEELFAVMLAKRDQWLPYLLIPNQSLNQFRNALERSLQNCVLDALENCARSFPEILKQDWLRLYNFAIENIAPTSKINVLYVDAIAEFPSSNLAALNTWKMFAELLLTQEYTWRKMVDKNTGFPADKEFKSIKKNMMDFLAQLNNHELLRKNLQALRQAPNPSYNESQWNIISALIQLLPLLAAHLKVLFQERSCVDYLEIALAALHGLGQYNEPSDLALKLDYQIKHILVDEFQDTSTTQFRLLEKLIQGWHPDDGRTLFLVGDPMQSIYRFREAEVGLFIKAQQEGLNGIALENLQLTSNFRSDAMIINWINQYFPKLFKEEVDSFLGAVPFCASVAMKQQQQYAAVELQLQLLHNETEKFAVQAATTVEIIKESLRQNPNGSIAILVRNRHHFKEIIPALKKAGLEFNAIEIETIYAQSIVADLFALTAALLNIDDRLNWLAVLRAPWCGLNLMDLHALAGEQVRKPLFQVLQNYKQQSGLSEDAQQRLQFVLPILFFSVQQRARLNLRLWVEQTWIALRGPHYLSEAQLQYACNYFELLEKWNLQTDIFDFEKDLERHYASAVAASKSNIHLMTIHKSKGLEFDTVIIPHLESKGRKNDSQLLMWYERPRHHGENELILAPIKASEKDSIYSYLRDIDQIKEQDELVRLFYVAVTRAKNQLYLLGTILQSDLDKNKSHAGSFLNLLSTQINFTNIVTESVSVSEPMLQHSSNLLTRLPLENFLNPSEINIYSSGNQRLELFESNNEKIIGSFIHRCLQQIAEDGLQGWSFERVNLEKSYWPKKIAQLGLSNSEIEKSIERIAATIMRLLDDKKAQWILQNHSEHRNEFAIAFNDKDQIQHLIIDRTFVDEQNIRWIIDYKTTVVPSENTELYLTQQQTLYQKQMQNYAAAMSNMDSRPIKLALYFTHNGAWREWDYF